MIVVARDEQKSVPLGKDACQRNPGREADTGNLSTIIDIKCKWQLQRRLRRNLRVQVDDRAVFPKKGVVRVVIARKRIAHHLTMRIDGGRLPEAVNSQVP